MTRVNVTRCDFVCCDFCPTETEEPTADTWLSFSIGTRAFDACPRCAGRSVEMRMLVQIPEALRLDRGQPLEPNRVPAYLVPERMSNTIDTFNKFLVTLHPATGNIIVGNPHARYTEDEALVLAAWLVALVDPGGARFAALLHAVLST